MNVKEQENYREYRTVDRSTWKSGAWDGEPDKAQWIDPTTGLDCLIVRNLHGALCGYVGVSETHALHGVDYDIVEIEVHGGLTFANRCAETKDESRYVCHVPAPGRPDHVWWFGFDCLHCYDVASGRNDSMYGNDPMSEYRDFGYVAREVAKLAEQLALLGGFPNGL